MIGGAIEEGGAVLLFLGCLVIRPTVAPPTPVPGLALLRLPSTAEKENFFL